MFKEFISDSGCVNDNSTFNCVNLLKRHTRPTADKGRVLLCKLLKYHNTAMLQE